LLLAGIGVQTKRVEWAKQEVVAKTVEAESFSQRLKESTARAKALQVSMDKLVSDRRELRALRGALDRRVKEVVKNDAKVRAWTDVPVPDAVTGVLRDRRERSDRVRSASATDASIRAVRAPEARPTDERRSTGADTGLR
jgi:hypothetical protein